MQRTDTIEDQARLTVSILEEWSSGRIDTGQVLRMCDVAAVDGSGRGSAVVAAVIAAARLMDTQ